LVKWKPETIPKTQVGIESGKFVKVHEYAVFAERIADPVLNSYFRETKDIIKKRSKKASENTETHNRFV